MDLILDTKVTVWERTYIPEEHKDKVLTMLKDGYMVSDIINSFIEDGIELHSETLYDTNEEMTAEGNDGCSTIEYFENDVSPKVLFENGISGNNYLC